MPCKILHPILVFKNSNHRLQKTDNVTCWQKSRRKIIQKYKMWLLPVFAVFYNSSSFTDLPKFKCLLSWPTNKLPKSINDSASVRSLCVTLQKTKFFLEKVGGYSPPAPCSAVPALVGNAIGFLRGRILMSIRGNRGWYLLI